MRAASWEWSPAFYAGSGRPSQGTPATINSIKEYGSWKPSQSGRSPPLPHTDGHLRRRAGSRGAPCGPLPSGLSVAAIDATMDYGPVALSRSMRLGGTSGPRFDLSRDVRSSRRALAPGVSSRQGCPRGRGRATPNGVLEVAGSVKVLAWRPSASEGARASRALVPAVWGLQYSPSAGERARQITRYRPLRRIRKAGQAVVVASATRRTPVRPIRAEA